jgi:uncharacterized membrane protein
MSQDITLTTQGAAMIWNLFYRNIFCHFKSLNTFEQQRLKITARVAYTVYKLPMANNKAKTNGSSCLCQYDRL